ncbi:MAG: EAL domain-containing protein [Magnetococcales bacterium]|nr:EAL domain-containing protein [Magnetococcales bacterium]
MLSQVNRAIVRADDPDGLYESVCRIAVEAGGFNLAWIGLIEPGRGSLSPVASSGVAAAELAILAACSEEGASGRDPAGQAVHDALPVIVADVFSHPLTVTWREVAQRWGIGACSAFPLRQGGEVIGALTVAATEVDFFKTEEIQLLTEVAADLSFALDVMRLEEIRAASESKMQYLAHYDAQTGLPGRALFEGRLEEITVAPGGMLAVLVIHLRRYHGVLQTLGQDVGLEIARVVADRLESILPTVFVARIKESKFALLLEAPPERSRVEQTARRVCRALSAGILVEDQELFLDPFVGMAFHPQDGAPRELLQHALVAATTVSQEGGGMYGFFVAEMERESLRRLDLDSALRRALDGNEFELHFQPQVELASGRVVGAEALLRWRRPGHGLVPPQDFIPLLEDAGLIWAVGEWVMHEACHRSREWREQGLTPIRMAVNLSARQFHGGDIQAMVRRALDGAGLDAEWLELELTEGVVLRNPEAVIRTMLKLNSDGITHALDDFGTGYSSLSYLQRLPVARIKIDKSFITNLTSSPGDAAITRAMVGMAHSLGLQVIAEGIENEGQLGFLRRQGCEEIQGFLFSRPLPATDFAALLLEGRGLPPTTSNKPERVLLVVDDEPCILQAIQRVLRRDGYRILATSSVREGFDLLSQHSVGVVVCDQRMKEMAGTEFLRRTKELHPDTVRIVLSGYTELSSVIDAVNRGAIYKFLTKPWEDDALSQGIKDAFRLYEMGRENREMSSRLQELASK